MPLSQRLGRLLRDENVSYRILPHREEFTARQVAEASHVPGRQVAKAVVVRDSGGQYLMAVVPADQRLELAALANATGRDGLHVAYERELARLFPDCEVGAMPPFGQLYDMPLYLDACLRDVPELLFQAGNHQELVGLSSEDYDRLARPIVGQFCFHAAHRKSA